MKKLKIILFLLITTVSCSDSEENSKGTLPELTTSIQNDITTQSLTITGTITNNGGNEILERGICYSFNSNPTINDFTLVADGSGIGSFSIDLLRFLGVNTTYHARAFATNEIGTSYGNDIEFTTKDLIEFKDTNIEGIMAGRIIISTRIEETDFNVNSKGFVFSEHPTPTIHDNSSFEGNEGYGNYSLTITGLSPDTVYYIRPYSLVSNGVSYEIYGEEISFKTVGTAGPSGGLVVYDKGFESDGWRYIESARNFNTNSEWGCNSSYISGLSTEINSGYSNTMKILEACSQNYSALYCNDYIEGGNDDWFLGSVDEMAVVVASLFDLNQINGSRYWTSNNHNNSEAYSVEGYYNYDEELIEVQSTLVYKKSLSFVIPIRVF